MSSPVGTIVGTIIFGGLIVWSIYRRLRRNIGRQALRPRRIVTRLVILSLVSVLFLFFSLQFPKVLAGIGGGMLLGALLGLLGLRLTKFETTGEGHFYTPNTQIGVALSLLFVGRMLYRFWIYRDAAMTGGQPPLFQSPLTFFIVGLNLGYGFAYYTGLLIHMRDKIKTLNPVEKI